MSDPAAPAGSTPAASTTPASTPPGWYDDGTGSGRMRWWSGTGWTEHVAGPSSAGVAVRPLLPADRPVYNVWIWLIVLLPLLSYASFLLWQPNFDYLYSANTLNDPTGLPSGYLTSLFSPGYFVILFGGWILYGLTVVFAWRDVVWLRAQGVVRPFPWPWVFLNSVVYVIGRSVIVRRVAPRRGLAPIWVLIAVTVVGLIVVTTWTVSITAGMLSHLPDFSSQYSS